MAPTLQHTVSPFLEPGPRTKPNSLAVLQLSRDNFVPVYLQEASGEHDGYVEGAVINTRYGSFPHSTLLNVPWGSQVRASKVDTGSRGRKRKRQLDEEAGCETSEPIEDENEKGNSNGADKEHGDGDEAKQLVTDASGFIHVLPPTPEIWTTSLPHRTQVVYTPDASYILHRIRARPGSTLIEAGAGSGSFTHASARAVYNGSPVEGKRQGRVFSFEFHEERYHKMKKELSDHGLDGVVTLTHRDVYAGGFLVGGKSPEADAVFLDLPAPWEALPLLSRQRPQLKEGEVGEAGAKPWVSPLHPKKSVLLCTFSPCIEQVTRTVSALRHLGWVDIEMVEIANRKLHTARDRVGLYLPVDRGVNNSAKDVEEAITKLTEIEERFRENARPKQSADGTEPAKQESKAATNGKTPMNGAALKYPWLDGRLVTRGEPEIKTHTSYLVFAVLPMVWTEEDEAVAMAKYPLGRERFVVSVMGKASMKEERREAMQQKQGNRKSRRKDRDEKLAEVEG
ncbi:S-adenosyl-L-methionine-dependent methyltransferase [Lasiosphaeria hispida]|uniref:tRNA (adenine(58)-N(1))-methyltransferase catalytic subunit TRM61 n=1 Tax=Lasiosphaeria hispida TaxID=260671 RepID=A0AAJ0MIB8_9PEZI|nr:S-adenosyl-L-methionine-dependent methyltransferase [Lasiosphaeria hispida]